MIMEGQDKIHFCICCMCGIPGSGKSTVCEQLSDILHGNYLILIINYDKILLDPSLDRAQLWKSLLYTDQKEDGENMKSARAQILSTVEFLMQLIMTKDVKTSSTCMPTRPGYINEDVWRGVMDLCWQKVCTHDFKKSPKVLFLVDDNMYFRSMRYEYYKIAKLYKSGFCEILVDSHVRKAQERNRHRQGRDFVNDEVIERISQKLEAPDSDKSSWEKYSSVIHAEDDGNMNLLDVTQMIQEAFANPAHPSLQVDAEERLESQSISSANLLHQTDLILRQCVSNAMKQGKEKSADLKQLSKQALSAKDNILRLMKMGQVGVPESLSSSDVKDSSKDEKSELYTYVRNLFECNLKSCQDG